MQHTGTFKARGAFNRILGAAERGELNPTVGVAVASGGNAGLTNAYAAAALGVPATVLVPRTSSPTKLHRLRTYGATVVPRGTEYAEAFEAAMEHVASTGAVHCHAYDQPEICAGAGTLGHELLDQLDGLGEQVTRCSSPWAAEASFPASLLPLSTEPRWSGSSQPWHQHCTPRRRQERPG